VDLGDKSRAAQVMREIALLHRKRKDFRATLEALRHAVKLVPEDFNSREQIIEILRELSEVAKMVEEGRALADALFKQNLLNRARRVLEKLLPAAPHDTGLRRLHALTLLDSGG